MLFEVARAIASLSDFCIILNAINPKYKCEEHIVNTSDGYIQLIYRIPATTEEIVTSGKPVIAFMHGTWQSADELINQNNFRGTPLSLIAVNMGYDVWCLNARGNKYSTHKTLNKASDAKSFYDFTWQHKGQFDIPAAIDYIKEMTNVPKVILWTTGQMITGVLRYAAFNPYY